MRIRVIRKPVTECIDGIQLDRFVPGEEYDVGTSLGALFLAEGWAEPLPPESADPSDPDPFAARRPRTPGDPPNLERETYPASLEAQLGLAADAFWRRRRR